MSDLRNAEQAAGKTDLQWKEVGLLEDQDDHEFQGTVLIPEDPARWRTVATAKRCRRQGEGHVFCQRAAVVELDRGRERPQWWGYCEHHTYSRILLDGTVYFVRVARSWER